MLFGRSIIVCLGCLLPCSVGAGEHWGSVSTGSPIFGYKLLMKAAQGLPVGGITDNVSVLSGRNLRYGVNFNHSPKQPSGFVSTISAGLFQFSLLKPNGLGVFIDPVTIDSAAIFIEMETGYRQQLRMKQRYLFSASASIGVQFSYATISAKSEVLNIKEDLFSANPYLQFKLERNLDFNNSLSSWISARLSGNNYQEISAGISWEF